MNEVKIGVNDLEISLDVYEDRDTAVITHFRIGDKYRNQGHGSFVIETVKRIAFTNHEIQELQVSIGGGRKTEKFLKTNGFQITNRREYSENAKERVEGDYGVDAVYKREWISDDYQTPVESNADCSSP